MSTRKRAGLRGVGSITAIACTAGVIAVASAAAVPRAQTSATTTVTTHHGRLGLMLAAGSGHTLYLSTDDKHNTSNCYGSCARAFSPLLGVGRVLAAKGSGVKQKLLGTTRRKGGAVQVTYNGHPLYLSSSDKKPGQMQAEGSKRYAGTWYVVGTSGNAMKPKTKSVCNPLCPGY